MAVYAAFPRSIRLLRACCSRVTHPCAGRRQKYCYSLAAPRLACVKPAASVHPEPGSNSSLYIFICILQVLSWPLLSLKGIYALMYFVLPYTSHTFFKYAACLYHYFNQLPFVSRTGLQRYAFFLSFQIQIKNFCIFFGIIFLLSNRLSATRWKIVPSARYRPRAIFSSIFIFLTIS